MCNYVCEVEVLAILELILNKHLLFKLCFILICNFSKPSSSLKFTFLAFLINPDLFCVGLFGNIRALWAVFMELSYKVFLVCRMKWLFSFCLVFPLVLYIFGCSCMSSFHEQAALVCCWGTSGKPCSIIPTYLYLSSSKLEMFEILNLHLVILVTFLANTEGMVLTSSHGMLPCTNNFSATFQLVSNDTFLVGAGQMLSLSGMLICLSLV